MTKEVGMDLHVQAMEYLEVLLGWAKLYVNDVDDVRAMVEQVVACDL